MSDSPFDKLFGGGEADGFFFGLPEERPGRAERRGPGEQNHTAEQQADPVIEERTE